MHFVTKVSLHFQNLRKILLFRYSLTPHCENKLSDPYIVHDLKNHDLCGKWPVDLKMEKNFFYYFCICYKGKFTFSKST
jgi:hypothetical protein